MIEKVFAEGICNPVIPGIIGCGGADSGGIAVGEIISNLVGLLFIVAFILAFFYLLTGGIYWITSGGDKGKLESARDRIINALIGLIVVAAAWAIASLAASFFCLDLTHLPIPTIGGGAARTSCRGSSTSGTPPVTGGDCSYAKNGGYACYTTSQCVQCVNGSTVFNVNPANCPSPCGR